MSKKFSKKSTFKANRLSFETLEDRSLLSVTPFETGMYNDAGEPPALVGGLSDNDNGGLTSAALLNFTTQNEPVTAHTFVTTSANQNKALTLSLTGEGDSDFTLPNSSYYGLKTGSVLAAGITLTGITVPATATTLLADIAKLVTVTTARNATMETGTGTVNIDLAAINTLLKNAGCTNTADDTAFTTLKAKQSIDIKPTVLYLGAGNSVLSSDLTVSIQSGAPTVTPETLTLTDELIANSATVAITDASGAIIVSDKFVMKVVGTTITPNITYKDKDGNATSITPPSTVTLSGSAFVVGTDADTGKPTIKFTPGTKFQYLPDGVTATFEVDVLVTDKTTLLQTTQKMTVVVTGQNSSVTRVTATLVGATAVTTTTNDLAGLSQTVFTPTTFSITDPDLVDTHTLTVASFTAKDKNNVLLTGTDAQKDDTYIESIGANGAITLKPAAFAGLEHGQSITLQFKIKAEDVKGTSAASGFITIVVTSGRPAAEPVTLTADEDTGGTLDVTGDIDYTDEEREDVAVTYAWTDTAKTDELPTGLLAKITLPAGAITFDEETGKFEFDPKLTADTNIFDYLPAGVTATFEVDYTVTLNGFDTPAKLIIEVTGVVDEHTVQTNDGKSQSVYMSELGVATAFEVDVDGVDSYFTIDSTDVGDTFTYAFGTDEDDEIKVTVTLTGALKDADTDGDITVAIKEMFEDGGGISMDSASGKITVDTTKLLAAIKTVIIDYTAFGPKDSIKLTFDIDVTSVLGKHTATADDIDLIIASGDLQVDCEEIKTDENGSTNSGYTLISTLTVNDRNETPILPANYTVTFDGTPTWNGASVTVTYDYDDDAFENDELAALKDLLEGEEDEDGERAGSDYTTLDLSGCISYLNGAFTFTPGEKFKFLPFGAKAVFTVDFTVAATVATVDYTMPGVLTVIVEGVNSEVESVTTTSSSFTTTTKTTDGGTTVTLGEDTFDPKFKVTDADVGDIHTFTIATTGFSAKDKDGVLLVGTDAQKADTYIKSINQTTGAIELDLEAFENLAVGESITLTFKVTATDKGESSKDSAELTITVTSGKFTTAETTIAVGEDDTSGTTAAAITISTGAAFTVTPNLAGISTMGYSYGTAPSNLPTITITATDLYYDTSEGVDKGKIVFKPGSQFNFLPEGITATFIVPYTVTSNGFTQTANVTITVTGKNDALTAVSATLAGTATTMKTAGADDLSDKVFTPTYTYTDPDKGDTYTHSLTAGSLTLKDKNNITVSYIDAADYLSVDADGKITLVPGAFKDLTAGQTITLTFKVTAKDSAATNQGTATTGDLTIIVTSGAPVVVDASISTGENTVGKSEELSVTTHPAGGLFTVAIGAVTGLPVDVTLDSGAIDYNTTNAKKFTFNPGTVFDYLPAGATEDFEVEFTVTDNTTGHSTKAKLTITVTGVNDDITKVTVPTDMEVDANLLATDAHKIVVKLGTALVTDENIILVTDLDVGDTHTFAKIGGQDLAAVLGATEDTTFYVVDNDDNTDGAPAHKLVETEPTDKTSHYGTIVFAADDLTSFTFTPNYLNTTLSGWRADADPFEITLAFSVTDGHMTTSFESTLTIAINGMVTNVAPEVTATVKTHNTFTTDYTDGLLEATFDPKYTVTDPDELDTHTFALATTGFTAKKDGTEIVGATIGDYLEILDNTTGVITLKNHASFASLAVGGKITLTFTVTVSDGNGGTDTTETLTITVTSGKLIMATGDDLKFDVTEDDEEATTNTVATSPVDGDQLDFVVTTQDTDDEGDNFFAIEYTKDGSSYPFTGTIPVVSLEDLIGENGAITFGDDGKVSFDPKGLFDYLPVGVTAHFTIHFKVTSTDTGFFENGTLTFAVEGLNDDVEVTGTLEETRNLQMNYADEVTKLLTVAITGAGGLLDVDDKDVGDMKKAVYTFDSIPTVKVDGFTDDSAVATAITTALSTILKIEGGNIVINTDLLLTTINTALTTAGKPAIIALSNAQTISLTFTIKVTDGGDSAVSDTSEEITLVIHSGVVKTILNPVYIKVNEIGGNTNVDDPTGTTSVLTVKTHATNGVETPVTEFEFKWAANIDDKVGFDNNAAGDAARFAAWLARDISYEGEGADKLEGDLTGKVPHKLGDLLKNIPTSEWGNFFKYVPYAAADGETAAVEAHFVFDPTCTYTDGEGNTQTVNLFAFLPEGVSASFTFFFIVTADDPNSDVVTDTVSITDSIRVNVYGINADPVVDETQTVKGSANGGAITCAIKVTDADFGDNATIATIGGKDVVAADNDEADGLYYVTGNETDGYTITAEMPTAEAYLGTILFTGGKSFTFTPNMKNATILNIYANNAQHTLTITLPVVVEDDFKGTAPQDVSIVVDFAFEIVKTATTVVSKPANDSDVNDPGNYVDFKLSDFFGVAVDAANAVSENGGIFAIDWDNVVVKDVKGFGSTDSTLGKNPEIKNAVQYAIRLATNAFNDINILSLNTDGFSGTGYDAFTNLLSVNLDKVLAIIDVSSVAGKGMGNNRTITFIVPLTLTIDGLEKTVEITIVLTTANANLTVAAAPNALTVTEGQTNSTSFIAVGGIPSGNANGQTYKVTNMVVAPSATDPTRTDLSTITVKKDNVAIATTNNAVYDAIMDELMCVDWADAVTVTRTGTGTGANSRTFYVTLDAQKLNPLTGASYFAFLPADYTLEFDLVFTVAQDMGQTKDVTVKCTVTGAASALEWVDIDTITPDADNGDGYTVVKDAENPNIITITGPVAADKTELKFTIKYTFDSVDVEFDASDVTYMLWYDNAEYESDVFTIDASGNLVVDFSQVEFDEDGKAWYDFRIKVSLGDDEFETDVITVRFVKGA